MTKIIFAQLWFCQFKANLVMQLMLQEYIAVGFFGPFPQVNGFTFPTYIYCVLNVKAITCKITSIKRHLRISFCVKVKRPPCSVYIWVRFLVKGYDYYIHLKTFNVC